VNSSVPTWLEAATNKALAKRPEDRFQRASAFATALRQGHKLEADSKRPTLPPRTPPPRTPPRERRVPTPAPDPSTPATKIRPAQRKRRRSPACLLLGLIAALALVIFGAAGLLFLSELGDIQDRGGSPGVVTSVISRESITIVVTPPSVEKSAPTDEPTLLPTRASASTPYPTIAPPQPPTPISGWDIPSLQASVTDFRFFESGSEQVPYDERQYDHSFAKSETRYIYYELHLEYPTREASATFEVSIAYYGPDDTVFSEFTANHDIEADWDSSWHAKGWGWKDPGEWPAGPYLVELYAEGNLIAADIFEIYE
jgi:hypothetical protein